MKNKVDIILIEDEKALREGLTQFFEMHNYSVASTDRYTRACELLDKYKPKCIISDFSLYGEGDGLDVYYYCKTVFKEDSAPFIFMTALSPYSTGDLKKLGVFKVLQKPFSLKQLDSAVNAAISYSDSRHPKSHSDDDSDSLFEGQSA